MFGLCINIDRFYWCGYRFEIQESRNTYLHWKCNELDAGLLYADGKFFAYLPQYSSDGFDDGTEALAYSARKSHENRMRERLVKSRLDALALLQNRFSIRVQFSFRERE